MVLMRAELVPAPAMAAGMLKRREDEEGCTCASFEFVHWAQKLARPMVIGYSHPSPPSIPPRISEKSVGLKVDQAHSQALSTPGYLLNTPLMVVSV